MVQEGKHIPTWICVWERRTPFNPIQPSWTARPPARSLHDSEEGSEVGVGQQRASDGPPSLDSLQTWPPPPPPNSFPSLARTLQIRPLPYFYLLLSPRLLATESAGRQIHPLPPWSKEAGRQHRLPSKGLGSQPAIPFPPPASPAIHSQSQEDIDRAGQGRAEQITDTSSSSKSLAESD